MLAANPGRQDTSTDARLPATAWTEYTERGPSLLHVEAAGMCNMRCPICPRGTGQIDRSGLLAWRDFHALFSMLAPALTDVVFSGWGEPLMNPETPRFIEHASREGLPVMMNTNGLLLCDRADAIVDSGLATINIALDGAVSRATHTYGKGSPFGRVIEGVKRLRNAKARQRASFPIIHGQFLVDEETVDEIYALTQWAWDIGVEHVKFKRRHNIMPGQHPRDEQRPPAELRKLYEHELVESTEDADFSHRVCIHPWETIFLACTGELGVCSWDPFQKINLGPVPDNFEAVWNGAKIRTVRRWHTGDLAPAGDPCRTCNRLPGYLRIEDARGE